MILAARMLIDTAVVHECFFFFLRVVAFLICGCSDDKVNEREVCSHFTETVGSIKSPSARGSWSFTVQAPGAGGRLYWVFNAAQ